MRRRRKRKEIFHARRRGYETTDVYSIIVQLFIPEDVDLASSSFKSCSFEVILPSDSEESTSSKHMCLYIMILI